MNDYVQAQVISSRFQRIGFSRVEVTEFLRMLYVNASFTVRSLQAYGYSFNQASRLKYMFDIFSGKIQVETPDEIARHLRKMSGGSYKIGMQDFPKSKITNIPRVAVIDNITQSPFDVWNSKNYKVREAIYKVIDVSGHKITVETSRKPQLPNTQTKRTREIFEIKGARANGNIVVTFNKNFCKLCNRFVVVCSLRNPEFHLGKYEMICFEGTKVYVYAINIGSKETVRINSEKHRIYDCGLIPNDIEGKLKNTAQQVYNRLKCAAVKYFEPNSTYSVVDSGKQ